LRVRKYGPSQLGNNGRATRFIYSTNICPICAKFCTNAHNLTAFALTVDRQTFRILKIQDGERYRQMHHAAVYF